MNLDFFYFIGIILIFLMTFITFISLFWINAPYGKHFRKGWGYSLPVKLAWILMELPAVIIFSIVFYSAPTTSITTILAWLWLLHYLHRTFIFPFRMHSSAKKMPLIVILMGFLFNTLNAFLNSYYLAWLFRPTLPTWYMWCFYIGIIIFFIGFYINLKSDSLLFKLRKPGELDYKIPHGFLFELISTPNYLGEVIEWLGFALAAFSIPALGFALFTIANLIPRAISHHAWYQKNFREYPKHRKAVIPFLL